MYHYTTTENAIKILNECQLKCSKYPTLNDPFDIGKDIIYDPKDPSGKIFKNAAQNNEELKLKNPLFVQMISIISAIETLKVLKKNIEDSHFSNMIKNTPFVCFSKKNDIPLLWAHYGEKYAGVVLEFDLIKNTAEEVKYKDFTKGILPSVLTAKKLINVGFLRNEEKLRSYIIELLLSKHKVWKYEQEIRLIGNPLINMNFFPFDPTELKGIYLGVNHKDNDELNKELNSDKYSHIKIYKMFRDPGFMNTRPSEIKRS